MVRTSKGPTSGWRYIICSPRGSSKCGRSPRTQQPKSHSQLSLSSRTSLVPLLYTASSKWGRWSESIGLDSINIIIVKTKQNGSLIKKKWSSHLGAACLEARDAAFLISFWSPHTSSTIQIRVGSGCFFFFFFSILRICSNLFRARAKLRLAAVSCSCTRLHRLSPKIKEESTQDWVIYDDSSEKLNAEDMCWETSAQYQHCETQLFLHRKSKMSHTFKKRTDT